MPDTWQLVSLTSQLSHDNDVRSRRKDDCKLEYINGALASSRTRSAVTQQYHSNPSAALATTPDSVNFRASMALSNSKTYTVIFTRHGESESNHPQNLGVDKMDPLLTTKETRRHFGNDETPGRDFCQRETANYYLQLYNDPQNDIFLHETSPVISSSLTRAIQTAVISLPAERLRSGPRIIVSPLVAEQTAWFSDRTRPICHLESLVDNELSNKLGCSNSLDLPTSKTTFNFHQLAYSPPDDESSLGVQFADQAMKQNDMALTEEQRHECRKPWHLKAPETLWHPKKLIERAREATRMLLIIARQIKDVDGRTPALVVFGHGGFINYLTEEVDVTEEQINSTPPGLTNWFTGETRVFKITDKHPNNEVPDVCLLEETGPSFAKHLARRKEWLKRNPGNNVKENALDYTQRSKTKDGNEEMRLRLQKKIVDMANDLGETPEAKASYAKSWNEGCNPSEVDGNHRDYCADILKLGN